MYLFLIACLHFSVSLPLFRFVSFPSFFCFTLFHFLPTIFFISLIYNFSTLFLSLSNFLSSFFVSFSTVILPFFLPFYFRLSPFIHFKSQLFFFLATGNKIASGGIDTMKPSFIQCKYSVFAHCNSSFMFFVYVIVDYYGLHFASFVFIQSKSLYVVLFCLWRSARSI
jgi:hypothetical protein